MPRKIWSSASRSFQVKYDSDLKFRRHRWIQIGAVSYVAYGFKVTRCSVVELRVFTLSHYKNKQDICFELSENFNLGSSYLYYM